MDYQYKKGMFFVDVIEWGIFGEGSHILTNQERENCAFSLLIGQNKRPFPKNIVLYKNGKNCVPVGICRAT